MSCDRDDLRALDIGITAAIETLAEVAGMHWENQIMLQRGESPAYDHDAFRNVAVNNCCHWNAAIERWQR